VSALAVVPITAVLHNRVFFRGMCMLNRIGPDYTLPTIKFWLWLDPSLPIAIGWAAVILVAGMQWAWVRSSVSLSVIATIPLTLWVWDIPFTGRSICHAFHDGRLKFGSMTVTSAWLYILSGILFVLLLMRKRAIVAREAPAR